MSYTPWEVAYAAITEVKHPGSVDELATAYSHAPVKDMKQNNILMSQKTRCQLQSSHCESQVITKYPDYNDYR